MPLIAPTVAFESPLSAVTSIPTRGIEGGWGTWTGVRGSSSRAGPAIRTPGPGCSWSRAGPLADVLPSGAYFVRKIATPVVPPRTVRSEEAEMTEPAGTEADLVDQKQRQQR